MTSYVMMNMRRTTVTANQTGDVGYWTVSVWKQVQRGSILSCRCGTLRQHFLPDVDNTLESAL